MAVDIFLGLDLARDAEKIKRNWVYVAKFSLYNDLTVKEILNFMPECIA